MKRFHAVVVILALGAIAAASAVAASGSEPNHDYTEARAAGADSGYAVAVLKDPPAASYTGGISGLGATKPGKGQKLDPNGQAVRAYTNHLRSAHTSVKGWLASNAPNAEVVREYFLTANAIAVKLNGTSTEALLRAPNVVKVTGSWTYQPAMTISNDLIDADVVWPSAGGRATAGSGIDVAIIDSGIDEDHPAFACKDVITHKVYAAGVSGDPSALLVNDHGTHVAGTVGGCVLDLSGPDDGPTSGIWSGVAPGATLHDYNVFPGFGGGWIAFGGSAFSHDICMAIEDAVANGIDVINMSLGGRVQGPHDLLAECTDRAVDAGVVVAVAASNDGPGDMTVASPGSSENAITVGATTNPHFEGVPFAATRTAPTAGSVSGGAAYGDFPHFQDVTAPYVRTTPLNGCATIQENLTGKIALIDRGVCNFGVKVRNAAAKGAIGVLVANNVAGDPSAMGGDGGAMPIPAAMVSKNNGAAMGTAGSVTIDGDNVQEFITANADIVAGFSSRGPTPFTFLAKPDLVAPGVNIYSSVFGEDGPGSGELAFAYFQGTSMATPHVSGAAALLLDLHGDWSPADVKSALANTAKRPVWDHVNGTTAVGVLHRGGGRIDLDAATASPVSITPVIASFGGWNGNKAANTSVTLTLSSLTGSASTCSVAVTGPAGHPVTASSTSVTVPATGTTTLTLSLSGGNSSTTGSGDIEGDVVLTCAGTELKAPWWVRIDRQGKP